MLLIVQQKLQKSQKNTRPPLVLAFRFVDISCERVSTAAEPMLRAGFSDEKHQRISLDLAYQSLSKLQENIRRFSRAITFRGAKNGR